MDDTIDSRYVIVLSVQTAQSVQAVHLLISGLGVRFPRGALTLTRHYYGE